MHEIEGESYWNSNFVSIDLNKSTNEILTVIRHWYPNREIDVIAISRTLNNNENNWSFEITVGDKYFPSAIFAENSVLLVSDSLYLLNALTGEQVSSKGLINKYYSGREPVMNIVDDNFLFLIIDGIGAKLIELNTLDDVWAKEDYFSWGLNEYSVFNNTLFSSATNLSLSSLNLLSGELSIKSELPYSCSCFNDELSIDSTNSILYLVDKNRLYAMQLD